MTASCYFGTRFYICASQDAERQLYTCYQAYRNDAQSLENNRRIQQQNNVPSDFPTFVRQGYDIKIMADGYDIDEKGLIYKVDITSA